MDGWVDGWMDGWMDGKAGLRIAYSNQKHKKTRSVEDRFQRLFLD